MDTLSDLHLSLTQILDLKASQATMRKFGRLIQFTAHLEERIRE